MTHIYSVYNGAYSYSTAMRSKTDSVAAIFVVDKAVLNIFNQVDTKGSSDVSSNDYFLSVKIWRVSHEIFWQ